MITKNEHYAVIMAASFDLNTLITDSLEFVSISYCKREYWGRLRATARYFMNS